MYIGGVEVARAGPSQPHMTVDINFKTGDLFELSDESANSVCKLTSIASNLLEEPSCISSSSCGADSFVTQLSVQVSDDDSGETWTDVDGG